MNWSRRAGSYGQVETLSTLPRDHDWSRGELEAVPSGDPPNDLLHRDREALDRGTAVDDNGEDGLLPQRGLPPACIVQQIRL